MGLFIYCLILLSFFFYQNLDSEIRFWPHIQIVPLFEDRFFLFNCCTFEDGTLIHPVGFSQYILTDGRKVHFFSGITTSCNKLKKTTSGWGWRKFCTVPICKWQNWHRFDNLPKSVQNKRLKKWHHTHVGLMIIIRYLNLYRTGIFGQLFTCNKLFSCNKLQGFHQLFHECFWNSLFVLWNGFQWKIIEMTAQNENCGFSPVTFSEYISLKIFLTVFLILLFPKVFPMVFPDKKNGRLWLLEPPTNGFTVCRRVFSLPPTYPSPQVHKSTCRTRFRGYSSHRSTPPPTRLLEREK